MIEVRFKNRVQHSAWRAKIRFRHVGEGCQLTCAKQSRGEGAVCTKRYSFIYKLCCAPTRESPTSVSNSYSDPNACPVGIISSL